jgi:hypothetical protein
MSADEWEKRTRKTNHFLMLGFLPGPLSVLAGLAWLLYGRSPR